MARGRPRKAKPATKGGEGLLAWLEQNGVTSASLAEQLGVTPPRIVDLLTDPKPNNKLQLFGKLKEITGISVDDWLEPPGQETKKSKAAKKRLKK